MSSSIDHPTQRSRVLRNVTSQPMPTLTELESLTGAARRAVDPAAVAEAQARGYADGRAEGYQDGYAAGRQEALDAAAQAEAATAEAVQSALDALTRASSELTAQRGEDIAAIEDALVDGALDLATAVVGRELAISVAPGRDALARALLLADGTGPAMVRMHPDDVATLGEHADLALGRELRVVDDPAVERGGCIVEVGDGRVDARLSTALDRVRQVLTS